MWFVTMQKFKDCKFLSLLLALMVFLGQGISTLHAHELDEHNDHKSCTICLQIQNHDDADTPGHVTLTIDYDSVTQNPLKLVSSFQQNITKPFHSQAPPLYS